MAQFIPLFQGVSDSAVGEDDNNAPAIFNSLIELDSSKKRIGDPLLSFASRCAALTL